MSLVQLEAIINVASLMVVFALWFWGIRPAIVETFRHSVFVRRNELFDHMASGHIAADNPAYIAERERMNALIRNAERLTLRQMWRVVAAGKVKAE